MTYDVIVIGLGGMGSAAAYRLATRGQRVLGIERFQPAHDQGPAVVTEWRSCRAQGAARLACRQRPTTSSSGV